MMFRRCALQRGLRVGALNSQQRGGRLQSRRQALTSLGPLFRRKDIAAAVSRPAERRMLATLAAAEEADVVTPPTRRQLWTLALSNAIPFVGFGFADNFLMILFGDAIDKSVGMSLGISTMAAAGIGNMLSDVVGIFVGETIEHYSSMFLGTNPAPPLTPPQMQLMVSRLIKGWASCFGIIIGCVLGMCPLLWLSDNRKLHFSDEEMTLYETCWRPYGVTPHAFFDVMRSAKWRDVEEGSVVVQGGVALDRVLLVASGAVDSYDKAPDGALRRLYRYRSKADIARSDDVKAKGFSEDQEGPMIRGCVIGGTALLDHNVRDYPYPSTVIAAEKTRIVEWPYEKLRKEMDDEKAIEAAMFSILYFDLVEGLKRKQARVDDDEDARAVAAAGDEQLAPSRRHATNMLETYDTLLTVALSDGLVHNSEREFISNFSLKYHITDAEHVAALRKLGWSKQQWDQGAQLNSTKEVLDDHQRIKAAIPQLLAQSGVKSRINTDYPAPPSPPPPPP